MGILLSEEEMPYPFNYYLSNTNVKVLQERLEALKKAQLKKVYNLLRACDGGLVSRKGGEFMATFEMKVADWQAFKKELE